MFHFGTDHTPNGGTASCRSAVFFGLEEEGRGLGEEWKRRERNRRERALESEEWHGNLMRRRGEDFDKRRMMGEDSERMKEDGDEDGHRT